MVDSEISIVTLMKSSHHWYFHTSVKFYEIHFLPYERFESISARLNRVINQYEMCAIEGCLQFEFYSSD